MDEQQSMSGARNNSAPPLRMYRKGPYDDCESVLDLLKEAVPAIENGLIGDHELKGVAMILDERLYDLVEAINKSTEVARENTSSIVASIGELTSAVRETAQQKQRVAA